MLKFQSATKILNLLNYVSYADHTIVAIAHISICISGWYHAILEIKIIIM